VLPGLESRSHPDELQPIYSGRHIGPVTRRSPSRRQQQTHLLIEAARVGTDAHSSSELGDSQALRVVVVASRLWAFIAKQSLGVRQRPGRQRPDIEPEIRTG
jgi:hypothetical protein